jgi:tight adherence protein C
MDVSFWVATGAATVSAALVAGIVVDFVADGRTPRPAQRAPDLAWLRLVWPLAARWGAPLGRRLPVAYAGRVRRRLRAAELDRALDVGTWTAALVAYALLAALASASVALALDLSAAPAAAVGALLGVALPEMRLKSEIVARESSIRRELPLYLDVLTLAVESGSSLTGAIALAASKAPDGPLRRAFVRFLGEVRAGRPRADALRSLDEYAAAAPVSALVGALLQSEKTGARLGKVLRAQAAQRTQERFARAEKLAMQAPVRMLGPLIVCIFPCTFLVLGFPIFTKLTAGF